MSCRTIIPLLVVAAIGASAAAFGQFQVGPIYPENANNQVNTSPRVLRSGEDPFRYNPHTGRFEYVPIPYDVEPPGSAYNPYRFDWHSGRWDYVPIPPPEEQDWRTPAREGVDSRLNPRLARELVPQPQPEPEQASATIGPSGVRSVRRAQPIPKAVPATAPTTAPSVAETSRAHGARRDVAKYDPAGSGESSATPAGPGEPPAMRVALPGRWEFDFTTGKWIFVLPPD